jgi:hypothetical protein
MREFEAIFKKASDEEKKSEAENLVSGSLSAHHCYIWSDTYFSGTLFSSHLQACGTGFSPTPSLCRKSFGHVPYGVYVHDEGLMHIVIAS